MATYTGERATRLSSCARVCSPERRCANAAYSQCTRALSKTTRPWCGTRCSSRGAVPSSRSPSSRLAQVFTCSQERASSFANAAFSILTAHLFPKQVRYTMKYREADKEATLKVTDDVVVSGAAPSVRLVCAVIHSATSLFHTHRPRLSSLPDRFMMIFNSMTSICPKQRRNTLL
jgi:hypothetical protein